MAKNKFNFWKEYKNVDDEFDAYMLLLGIVLLFILTLPIKLFKMCVIGFFKMIRI